MKADDRLFVEVFAGFDLMFFLLGFWIRRREMAPQTWPKVSGVIVTCKLDQKSIQVPHTYGTTRYLVPVLEYEFYYLGQKYRTSHWRPWNFTSEGGDGAKEATLRYPFGSTVTVFVNEKNPNKSVLEARISALSWVPFWFGFLFLALTLLLIIALGRQ